MLRLHDDARNILNKRINAGTMSVKLFAQKTGLSQGYLSNYRNGNRYSGLRALGKIIAALGFDAELVPLSQVHEKIGPADAPGRAARLPVMETTVQNAGRQPHSKNGYAALARAYRPGR